MEKAKKEEEEERKDVILPYDLPRKQVLNISRSPKEEVQLAATAIRVNARLRSADMPINMQDHALCFGRSLLDSSPKSHNNRPNPSHIARALKKEFDMAYGPAWHCIVGKSFGSYVTHSPGGFVYFSIDTLSFLLFKTEVHLVKESQPHPLALGPSSNLNAI
ncbi:Dynein light chain, type 1/2 [Dillenia turbinata]|uniref:Dynein light chain n=1 Tax=Dillenia turbinata TaxID=194707 RepID=A0AAN8VVL6_9MAGN